MILEEAEGIARGVVELLKPHSHRIEIAGSIRRKKPEVGDIEVVYIAKTKEMYQIVEIVNKWYKKKGDAIGLYTQRLLPEGIKLDLFRATPENWGYVLAIRIGSADFSKRLASAWVKAGYHGKDGMLTKDGVAIPVREERDLFRLVGMKWIPPEDRL